MAERYGLTNRNARCAGCSESEACPFYLDLRAYLELKRQYLDQEQYDGYFRDQCVFSPDIDIEDTMHVVVTYRSGATMSSSLYAFMPWEGYIVSFNGSNGWSILARKARISAAMAPCRANSSAKAPPRRFTLTFKEGMRLTCGRSTADTAVATRCC
jgi:hypothetical protein